MTTATADKLAEQFARLPTEMQVTLLGMVDAVIGLSQAEKRALRMQLDHMWSLCHDRDDAGDLQRMLGSASWVVLRAERAAAGDG
jgi:hypothetical protein